MATGTEDFNRLAADFKRAGAKGLQGRLQAGLQRSARPAIAAAKKSAATNLPKSGGKDRRVTRLRRTGTVEIDGATYIKRRRVSTNRTVSNESVAERVQAAKFVVRSIPGRNPRVRITATARGKKKIDLDNLDKGVLRHPLFGNRRHWYMQRVQPLWFTRPMEDNANVVLRELEKAVGEIEKDITGK